jgi:hypothetical protein
MKNFSKSFALASTLIAMAFSLPTALAVTLNGVALKHGDLIFTQHGRDIVLYPNVGQSYWEAHQQRLRKRGQTESDAVGAWSHVNFLRHFLHGVDDPVAAVVKPGTAKVPIGHVAFFVINEQGEPFVFEAAEETEGVRRVAWRNWLLDNLVNNEIWVARMKFSEEQAAAIIDTALTLNSREYDITNLDLNDASGFYSSKLVWHAVKKAIGVALDDNPEGKRQTWYSPRQVLTSKYVTEIYRSNKP